MIAKLAAFVKRPVVSHTLAALLAVAATSLSSGKLDVSGLVSAVAGAFAPATTPIKAPTLTEPAP